MVPSSASASSMPISPSSASSSLFSCLVTVVATSLEEVGLMAVLATAGTDSTEERGAVATPRGESEKIENTADGCVTAMVGVGGLASGTTRVGGGACADAGARDVTGAFDAVVVVVVVVVFVAATAAAAAATVFVVGIIERAAVAGAAMVLCLCKGSMAATGAGMADRPPRALPSMSNRIPLPLELSAVSFV